MTFVVVAENHFSKYESTNKFMHFVLPATLEIFFKSVEVSTMKQSIENTFKPFFNLNIL